MAPATFLLRGDIEIHRLGYGAMRLCAQPGNFGPYPDWSGGERLLRRAVELGINFIDTAEAYGPGHNEELIASALHPYAKGVVIATKGGVNKTSATTIFPDGRPENLCRACDASLKRLRVDRIDLYQLHRPDPKVPLSESVSALATLRADGKIRHIGLSNVTLAQVEEARRLVPIVSVQNRYNLRERGSDDVLDYCERHGLAFLPYGPLGAQPFERTAPLSATEGQLAAIATQLRATPAQVALAWLLHHSKNIVVIPGTTTLPHLEENATAARLSLSVEDIAVLSAMKTE